MVEPEVAYAELPELLDLAEEFVVSLVARVLERCQPELKTLERDTSKLETVRKPFPRMTYDEAAALLARPDLLARARAQDAPPFAHGSDFGAFDETLLTETLDRTGDGDPLSRGDQGVSICSPTPRTRRAALCVDVWLPRATARSSAEPENPRHELLLKTDRGTQAAARRSAGTLIRGDTARSPTPGSGMGIERFVSWVGGLHHLREAIPYPRTINRLYP